MSDQDTDEPASPAADKLDPARANGKGPIVRTEGQRLLGKIPLSVSALAASIGGASKASVCHWRNGVKVPSAEFRAKLFAVHGIPIHTWVELPDDPDEQAPPDPDEQAPPDPAPTLNHSAIPNSSPPAPALNHPAIPDSSPPASPSTVPSPTPPSSPTPPLLAPPAPAAFPSSPSTVPPPPVPPAAPPPKASRSPKLRAVPAADGDRIPSTKEDCLSLLASLRGSLAKPNLVQSERSRLNADFNRALTLRRRLELDEELAEDRIVREHPTWALIRRGIARALVPYPNAAQAVAAVLTELEV